MNYQERVSTATDVRALFDRVKQNPAIEKYRGYTDSKSYGWDPIADCYIKREGEVWFGNPAFDETYVPEGVATNGSAELLDEQLAEKERLLAALDARCEQQRKQIETLSTSLAQREEMLESIQASMGALRNALSQVMQLMPTE